MKSLSEFRGLGVIVYLLYWHVNYGLGNSNNKKDEENSQHVNSVIKDKCTCKIFAVYVAISMLADILFNEIIRCMLQKFVSTFDDYQLSENGRHKNHVGRPWRNRLLSETIFWLLDILTFLDKDGKIKNAVLCMTVVPKFNRRRPKESGQKGTRDRSPPREDTPIRLFASASFLSRSTTAECDK